MENILTVEDLSVAFSVDKTWREVVHKVNFHIKQEEIFALVGESGSGKTVTANTIMRLLPKNAQITNGQILFNPAWNEQNNPINLTELKQYGQKMRKLRGNNISMIFQNPISSLNPAYTVGEQIMENIFTHRKVSKAEARTQTIELLNDLGIQDPERRIDQYPHEFSGGMAQRVMIAIAMVNKPDLLIADEPTTALDVTVQKQIMQLLRKLCRDYKTSILLITHNMGIVQEYTDDVAVMYHGHIVEKAPTAELFKNPAHPYTKALLNSIVPLGKDKNERLRTIEDEMAAHQEYFTFTKQDYKFKAITPEHLVLEAGQ